MDQVEEMMAASQADDGKPKGQYLLATAASNAIWSVPADVTEISIVCIQGPLGTIGTQTSVMSTTGAYVCKANSTEIVGDGGGVGGAKGGTSTSSYGGGGGAGGYLGPGGTGGAGVSSGTGASGGSSTSGGAGGGGGVGTSTYSYGGGGGGSSPYGIVNSNLASGGAGATSTRAAAGGQGAAANAAGAAGSAGSGAIAAGGLYGGGAGGQRGTFLGTAAQSGGSLAWINNVAVTPGQQFRLTNGVGGCIRIMWGGGRSFPYNAQDV